MQNEVKSVRRRVVTLGVFLALVVGAWLVRYSRQRRVGRPAFHWHFSYRDAAKRSWSLLLRWRLLFLIY